MQQAEVVQDTCCRPIPFGWFTLLLSADVMVLLFEKIAVDTLPSHLLDFNRLLDCILLLLCNAWLWGGLLSALIQLWAWLKILEKTELSLAYPIASLGYPLTMLAAHFFLGEVVDMRVWLGGALITLGVVIVGNAKHTSPPGS